MKISLLITGGTLDKVYLEQKGTLGFDATHLPEMLKQAHCTLDIELETVFLKDSLDMTYQDRQQLLRACKECSGEAIVITHGTDTMAETARVLNAEMQNHKPVVLTGAMRPFSLGASDSLFNLGAALMAAQICLPGVYIAMNGQLFDAESVQKNVTLGQFERIE